MNLVRQETGLTPLTSCACTLSGGGGVSIHDGGSTELQTIKIHKPEILDPKKIPGVNISCPRQDFNSSVRIYSIKHTLLMHDFASIIS